MKSIGIVGFGKLGSAIAAGIRNARPQWDIFATRGSSMPMPPFVMKCNDNNELLSRTRLILLCVKPHQARSVLQGMRANFKAEHIVISACAGVNAASILEAVPDLENLVRIMPNVACEVNAGATAVAFSKRWKRDCRSDIVALFESLGRVAVLDEVYLDTVTALSGCGPAFVCVIIEALIDAGVKEGLDRKTSRVLVAQTLLGSAKLILESGRHPAEIRDDVTTPGGATIHGLAALEQGKLRAALISAVEIAAARARGAGYRPT